MASSGSDWFGGFKAELADHFGNDAVSQMSTYFDLPPRKRDHIQESKNSGLELLSVLEAKEVIGKEAGIDELCEALKFCNLNKLAREAKTLFSEPREIPGHDTPDIGPASAIDIPKLKIRLRYELTAQECYEVAMTLGLPAKVLQEIKDSKDCACLLIERLHAGNRIKSTNVSALLFALRSRGLIRVANLIQNSDDLYRSGTAPESVQSSGTAPELLQSSGTDTESNTGFKVPSCICGENSYEELKSYSDESRTVSLRCQKCSAEWFETSLSSKDTSGTERAVGDMSLSWQDSSFSYRIPHELDLSELKNENVSDVKQLRRGDQIIFRRYRGFYDHHAIFLGKDANGKMDLIEWSGNSRGLWDKEEPTAKIKRNQEPFPSAGVKRRIYKRCDPADVVIARASNMMKNSEEKYDLISNNCESFGTYCKVGKSISTQGKVLDDILPPFLKNIKKVKSFLMSN